MQHKRKKASRYRASTTHGCGSMKKRRGKGNKGGAGNAGSGKRADQQKPSFWKFKTGRLGFISKSRNKLNAITFADVLKMVNKGLLKEENGVYDLGKANYDKLLSKGPVKGLKIKVAKASASIIEDVKAAGGEVIVDNVAAEPAKEEAPEAKVAKPKE